MAFSDAGSRMHVLDWVESRGCPFQGSLNELLKPTGAVVGNGDAWRPLGRHTPEEARLCRPCEPLLPAALSRTLRAWWLKVDHPRANEPNWDLAATATFPGGRRGLVLVEAKAHVEEFVDELGGKRKTRKTNADNHEQIGRAISEAQRALGGEQLGVRISRDSHYQFSNRVAFGWKLASEGVPTVIVYLGFLGDAGMRDRGEPLRDEAQWRHTIMQHTAAVLPSSFYDRQIDCGKAILYVLIRSLPCTRQSPHLEERRRDRRRTSAKVG